MACSTIMTKVLRGDAACYKITAETFRPYFGRTTEPFT